jgi:hypothetical protein
MGMRITNFRQQVEREGTNGGHKNGVIAQSITSQGVSPCNILQNDILV